MEDFISFSVSSFIHFLTAKESDIKNTNSDKILISFAVQLKNFSYSNKLNSLLSSDSISFLFEHPTENFSFIGLNEALSIAHNGVNRFSVEQEATAFKKNFINNWEIIPSNKIPLFVGGTKFPADSSDEMWKDFDDSMWFIPETSILKLDQNIFLFYNFLFPRQGEKEFYAEKLKINLVNLFSNDYPANPSQEVNISAAADTCEKTKWLKLVDEGLKNISKKKFDKVVLSRKVGYDLSNKPDFNQLIDRLKNNYPDCYTFLFHRGKSFFFGATPEKLARFSQGVIEIDALAGSAPRGNTEEEDLIISNNLLNDAKNLKEHSFVLDFIKNSLERFTREISSDKQSIKKLTNIQHILTHLKAKITSGTIFSILKELYPTPAICGYPKQPALQSIIENENYTRGLYSGIIGWFNFDDEAEFVVAIRSGLITNKKLFAFAGSGIVCDSNPEDEYEETQLKLKPILSLFNNEN